MSAEFFRRHDIYHNDTQHNDIQHNDIQQNANQHNDTPHNNTGQVPFRNLFNVTLNVIRLIVVMLSFMAPFFTLLLYLRTEK
jgi:hypothetical protein